MSVVLKWCSDKHWQFPNRAIVYSSLIIIEWLPNNETTQQWSHCRWVIYILYNKLTLAVCISQSALFWFPVGVSPALINLNSLGILTVYENFL